MSEKPKEEMTPKEENQPKEECCKKECPDFKGFHGFGPRCHARHFGFPMFGPHSAHPHRHKERKCECGEVIPKRKEGEPKVKVCPKCGKDLPKKKHGFGMRCHKMKKMMKFMNMFGGQEFGPQFGQDFGPHPPCPNRGLEVNHYIHFGSPEHRRHHHGPHGRGLHHRHGFGRPPMGPGFGRPPMGPGFGRPPMGPGFGRPPMGPGFGRPPMGPGFGRPPMGPQWDHQDLMRKESIDIDIIMDIMDIEADMDHIKKVNHAKNHHVKKLKKKKRKKEMLNK